MRWKRDDPKHEDVRWVFKFAWLPTYAYTPSGDLYLIWLEKYKQKQVYREMWGWIADGNVIEHK
jgi:hypothetical protein